MLFFIPLEDGAESGKKGGREGGSVRLATPHKHSSRLIAVETKLDHKEGRKEKKEDVVLARFGPLFLSQRLDPSRFRLSTCLEGRKGGGRKRT